jgi:hypothetical protein
MDNPTIERLRKRVPKKRGLAEASSLFITSSSFYQGVGTVEKVIPYDPTRVYVEFRLRSPVLSAFWWWDSFDLPTEGVEMVASNPPHSYSWEPHLVLCQHEIWMGVSMGGVVSIVTVTYQPRG